MSKKDYRYPSFEDNYYPESKIRQAIEADRLRALDDDDRSKAEELQCWFICAFAFGMPTVGGIIYLVSTKL